MQIEKNREERRRAMAAAKKERQVESMMNERMGHPGDVDFQRMIRGFREQNSEKRQSHAPPGETKITICVRKRPVNAKEVKKRDYDAVTCLNPMAIVHDCKLKVDGITKYLDSNAFSFDHVRCPLLRCTGCFFRRPGEWTDILFSHADLRRSDVKRSRVQLHSAAAREVCLPRSWTSYCIRVRCFFLSGSTK